MIVISVCTRADADELSQQSILIFIYQVGNPRVSRPSPLYQWSVGSKADEKPTHCAHCRLLFGRAGLHQTGELSLMSPLKERLERKLSLPHLLYTAMMDTLIFFF